MEQLRPVTAESPDEPDHINVIRLVEFLGPVSPELVLVDPELAARARALLPDSPGVRVRRPERDEPIPLRPAPRPAHTRGWTVATVLAVAAVSSVFFGLGLSTAAPRPGKQAAIETRPPVAPPAADSVSGVPDTSVATPTELSPGASKPKPATPTSRPAAAPPRFVWPAVDGAKGYRIALYRGGRQIFERDVASTGFQLTPSWTFGGRFYRLEKGAYRWVVWPLNGKKPNLGQGPAIVSARYVV